MSIRGKRWLLHGLVVGQVAYIAACTEGAGTPSDNRTSQTSARISDTYGPVYNDEGEVTSLPGYTEHSVLGGNGTLAPAAIDAVADEPIFTYEAPFAAQETTFSQPQAISGSFLAPSSTGAEACSGLAYEPTIPRFRDLPKKSGSYFFCIKTTLKSNEPVYFVTPPVEVLEDAAPSGLALATTSGSSYTTQLTVDLALTAIGAAEVYVTNTVDCAAGGVWQAYTPFLVWTLPAANAVNDVYAKFRSSGGKESTCLAATLTHDSLAPENVGLAINDAATHTVSATVTLNLAAAGATVAYVTNTPDCLDGGSWEAFTTDDQTWSLAQTNGLASVYAKFRDAAGNESPCASATITHDAIAPTSASISISAGATYTTSTSVTLGLAAVGASEVYVTNTAGCASGGSWEAYTTTKPGWNLSQTNTSATVYAKYRDEAGNETTCRSDVIIHDNISPTDPGSFADGSSTSDATTTPNCTWTPSTDGGSGVTTYQIAVGTTAGGNDIHDWTAVGDGSSAQVSGLSLASGLTYYASIRALDQAGNTSSVVNGDGFTVAVVWSQQAFIKAPNAKASTRFGESVSLEGDTLAVGTHYENSSQTTITNGTTTNVDTSVSTSGAAYIFKRSGLTWASEAFIKAANADAADEFGRKLSLSGETLAIPAHGEASDQATITNGATASASNVNAVSGAVYVYKRTAVSWAQEAYIKASNSEANDQFAGDIAIDGDTLVAGAPKEDSNQTTITNGGAASGDNSLADSGAVYVYVRNAAAWSEQAYLKAVNADATDDFGDSVALQGDTLVVGARFENSADTTITNGSTASNDDSLNDPGAVYVYQRTATNWAQQAYIKAQNAGVNDRFGYRIALYGETLGVGAYLEDSAQTTITSGGTASADDSNADAGAVYMYKRTANNWAQEAYIKAVNNSAGDNFGYRVALYQDRLAVAATKEDSSQTTVTNGPTASSDDTSVDSGAVYLYKRSGTLWQQEAYVKAANSETLDSYGIGIALYDKTLAVSANLEDSGQTTISNGAAASSDNSLNNSGAVYIYTTP